MDDVTITKGEKGRSCDVTAMSEKKCAAQKGDAKRLTQDGRDDGEREGSNANHKSCCSLAVCRPQFFA